LVTVKMVFAPVPTAGLALVLGAPAGAVVVVRAAHGASVATVLLATVLLYDAAMFIVGTGAANRWEGPAAGILTIVPFTVIVASVLAPPFRGTSAWVLGAVAVVLRELDRARLAPAHAAAR